MLGQLRDTAYVLRTAWLYGAHGKNFVRTMIRLEGLQPETDVVDDQRGQPTWTVDVADQIIALIQSGAPPGVYHATSSGQTTWCGLAREIFRLLGADRPESGRPPAAHWTDLPSGPPIAFWATPGGAGPVSRPSATGSRH